MTKQEFEAIYEQLTKKLRPVLKEFLQGKPYKTIAKSLEIEPNTVCSHISTICHSFKIRNESGGGNTQRDELIQLFVKYKRELVCEELLEKFGERTSDTPKVLKLHIVSVLTPKEIRSPLPQMTTAPNCGICRATAWQLSLDIITG